MEMQRTYAICEVHSRRTEAASSENSNLPNAMRFYRYSAVMMQWDSNSTLQVRLNSSKLVANIIQISDEEIVETDVLLLFILSHGREDGFIETDSGEQFTTYEVIDALKKLSTFKDTLKLIFFGVNNNLCYYELINVLHLKPCRGQYHDTVFFTRGRTTSETHEVDSCAVGSFPNESNFIIFYSTVECKTNEHINMQTPEP